MHLPVLDKKEEIIKELLKTGRLVLSSPAGSGKSTQVPQFLLDSGRIKGRIAVLQPRRLAARMLAARVSAERGSAVGKTIGCRVKLEDSTSAETRIIFETEGILLRELISDPQLKKYGCIIFDEFHERHLASDLALSACLELQKKTRPDLLLIAMSATLDIDKISDYMSPCAAVKAEGRMYPVTIKYCDAISAKQPVWETAAKAAAMLAPARTGNVLVFMPGAYEINRTIEEMRKRAALSGFDILPLYGSMKNDAQDRVLAAADKRKIIVATNIAETSLTVNGVELVIDSGLAKTARYDAARAVNTLFTGKITRASAEQRAGRAGRTAPGMCLRLWTEAENRSLPPDTEPEILRLDLSESLLLLKACGYKTFSALKWIDLPPQEDIDKAEKLLNALGAADKNGKLTEEGRRMAAFPLSPRYSKMLVESARTGCLPESALIAAAAQGKTIWLKETRRENSSRSDLYAAAEALKRCKEENFSYAVCGHYGIERNAAREACELAASLIRAGQIFSSAKSRNAAENSKKAAAKQNANMYSISEKTAKAFLQAFPDRIAALLPGSDKRYAMPGGKRASLDKYSAANGARIIAAGEALEKNSSGSADIMLSFAAEIKEEWLRQIFPDQIKEETAASLDPEMLSPVMKKNLYYRDVLLKASAVQASRSRASSELIAEEFISGRHKFTEWNEETEEWLARIDFLSKACPDFGIEPLSEEDTALIINDICSDAKSVSDAKNRPVLPHLKDWYGWEICRLIDKYAPDRMKMPGGRRARIRYPRNGEPYLEAKIQDLYEFRETPRIAAGRVPLVIHILAPSMRPVQVTKDLKNFWENIYPELKPALSRRYPKHKWL